MIGFFLENLDKQLADNLALGLRIGFGAQRAQEAPLGIDADDANTHVFGKGGHDLVTLLVTQQPGIDKHAGQLIADGLVQQRRHDRGIHATGQAQQHLVIAYLLTDLLEALVDDIARGPQCLATTDVDNKTPQDTPALAGMGDFGVKLHAVETARIVGHARNRCRVGAGHQRKALGQIDDTITVAHPDIQQAVAFLAGVVFDIGQQARVAAGPHLRVAIFVVVGILHPAAQLRRHGLHTVADTQHRYAQFEHQGGSDRRAAAGDTFRTAGEDHAVRVKHPHVVVAHIPGMDFAVDADLSHPAGDQLGVLRTEVQDQDSVGVDVWL